MGRSHETRQDKRPLKGVANHEIVTVAVYLLGGDSQHVATEDVAVKANELAPGRFTWRKYADQINLEMIRVYLSDAKKPEKGAYLVGSGNDGWLLTEEGVEFVRKNAAKLHRTDLSGRSLSSKQKQWLRTERTRLLTTVAFQKFQSGATNLITHQEAEAFFRIDAYVIGEQRERKILRIVNAFGRDEELGDLVRALAAQIRAGGNEQ